MKCVCLEQGTICCSLHNPFEKERIRAAKSSCSSCFGSGMNGHGVGCADCRGTGKLQENVQRVAQVPASTASTQCEARG
jgi:hypothetical protein